MRRHTHKRPKFFSVGEEDFKSEALGYLDAGEFLMNHMPSLMQILEILKDIFPDKKADEINEEEFAELDLIPLLDKMPKGFIKQFSQDLLVSTYVKDAREDEQGNLIKLQTYSQVDPQDFSGLQECIQVLFEVFKHNFPDFFQEGSDTEEKSEQSEPMKEKAPVVETQTGPKRTLL